jgi:hypothetical protein
MTSQYPMSQYHNDPHSKNQPSSASSDISPVYHKRLNAAQIQDPFGTDGMQSTSYHGYGEREYRRTCIENGKASTVTIMSKVKGDDSVDIKDTYDKYVADLKRIKGHNTYTMYDCVVFLLQTRITDIWIPSDKIKSGGNINVVKAAYTDLLNKVKSYCDDFRSKTAHVSAEAMKSTIPSILEPVIRSLMVLRGAIHDNMQGDDIFGEQPMLTKWDNLNLINKVTRPLKWLNKIMATLDKAHFIADEGHLVSCGFGDEEAFLKKIINNKDYALEKARRDGYEQAAAEYQIIINELKMELNNIKSLIRQDLAPISGMSSSSVHVPTSNI